MLAIFTAAWAAGFMTDGPRVQLRYAQFDPRLSEPAVPAELAAAAGSRLVLVQFARTPGDAERAALAAAGCEILQYIPDHAYVVRAPAGAQPGGLPGVRWAGPFHPAYKLDETILTALAHPEPEAIPARYGILLWDTDAASQARLETALREAGARLDGLAPGSLRVEAVMTPAQALAAARLDEVHFIDPAGPPGADMNIVRELTGANHLQSVAGISGQGVRGEVMDTSINLAHPAFQNPPPILHGPNGNNPDHGNASYAIVFANDPAQQRYRGMIPDREQGIFATYTTVIMGGRRQHLEELVSPAGPFRGLFQSNSWGSAQVTTYSTVSAQLDDDLLHVDVVLTQSQSNTGSQLSRPEAWAKNAVSVGGFNHNNTLTRADDLASNGTSFGPASDGRVKPDAVGVMDNVVTVTNGPPPPSYSPISGTSVATAVVAGHVGLICQMWHDGVFPGFGGGASVFDDRPHAATTRALLFNSTFVYDWWPSNPGARNRQGWGTPDLRPLYERAARTFVVDESDVLSAGRGAEYRRTVVAGEPELRATMVYTDPPGSPAAQAQHRVNDLSLRVTSPLGVVYWGNAGLAAGPWSQPGGAADTKNVVENVLVQNPEAGEWRFEVIATEVVSDAHLETPGVDADFALVVAGAVAGCYADCNGDGTLNLSDFGCFTTKFALGDPYADCNGDQVLNLSDFGCFTTRFALGCP